jgi:hypothetical protein
LFLVSLGSQALAWWDAGLMQIAILLTIGAP